MLHQSLHHSKTISEFKLESQSRKAKLGSKLVSFLSCMTLKFDRWPWHVALFLCYLKLCTSFRSQQSIQTGVTVQKHLIQVKIGNFLSCSILIFDRRPWKTIGHLFYTTSSFVHHFIAICKFKPVQHSGNSQIGKTPVRIILWCPTTKMLIKACFLVQPLEQEGGCQQSRVLKYSNIMK